MMKCDTSVTRPGCDTSVTQYVMGAVMRFSWQRVMIMIIMEALSWHDRVGGCAEVNAWIVMMRDASVTRMHQSQGLCESLTPQLIE